MSMNARNRMWVIGSVAAMVAILLLAWFVGIQPQLASLAAVQAQQVGIDAQNARERAVLDQLEADAGNETELQAEWAVAAASVPSGTGVPEFIDQLNALATSTGVAIERITVSDPAAYVVAPPAEVGADAAGEADDGSGAEGETADASGSASAAPVGSATSALLTPANFATMQIGLEVSGAYPNILEFVHGLQTGERLMLVNEFEVSVEATDPNATAEDSAGGDGSEEAAPAPTIPGHQARIGGYIFSLVNAEEAASTQDDLGAQQAAAE
ncbi:Tfp pilus assembly protein PilO [Agromyces terreus]|uniref:Tfp pilus assembly protein PilO n=1 Tax=Agromyces terreus TaxID=424795 RepID=A0A9X2H0T5_9MICO|nr:hypothetical protein [Agromyces terreus]MCP2371091.1 Tfp pilus assembly protein PilO [Agromyces terreus]